MKLHVTRDSLMKILLAEQALWGNVTFRDSYVTEALDQSVLDAHHSIQRTNRPKIKELWTCNALESREYVMYDSPVRSILSYHGIKEMAYVMYDETDDWNAYTNTTDDFFLISTPNPGDWPSIAAIPLVNHGA